MNQFLNSDLNDIQKRRLFNSLVTVFVLLAVFLGIKSIGAIKEASNVGRGVVAANVLNVNGLGEVLAVPDTATFSFSVIENAKTMKEAQDKAAVKTNAIIDAMKKMDIADKDIKTTGYNSYPQYDYVQASSCVNGYCPPGKQVLRGYEVTQTITVKVRKTDDAGAALSKAGDLGASNISGLEFVIDDMDKVKGEARDAAIQDAKEKAKVLSKSLGVKLKGIVNFQESGSMPQPMYYGAANQSLKVEDSAGTAPVTPMGENKITSNVTITYEIE
jgi:uncharacterized protein YggE